MGNENMTASPSGAFATADGLLNIAANEQGQFETLCDLVGRPDLKSDPRFAEREERKRRRVELKVELEAALSVHPANEWAAMFNRHGVPAGEVLDVPAMLAHPQVTERRLVRAFDDVAGVDREVSVLRSGFRLASGDPEPAFAPRPLGADTNELLAELGYGAAEIDALRREGAA
jgi:crotonobetainyl-CoA:carnitine CoA-transferase CaiB-like acyl-CoA transferase